ncbi:MAG: phosphoribosylglycinamide formyltransferase [Gemmatimonadaceae bacterium]
MTIPSRIAVLASGGGSNLQSIIEHFRNEPASKAGVVVFVGSNRADAGALQRARAAGIATFVIADSSDGASLLAALRAADIDLLVLAGYLRLVPNEVVHAFAGRVLNVHPALLPAFGGHGMYGQRVHTAVIASGAKFTGVTVHFVNEVFDQGTIAAQWPVPVLPDDTPLTLAVRVVGIEHAFFPAVIEAVASGAITMGADNRSVGSIPAHSPFAPRDAQLFFRPD